ncbi:enoyl-CoA hydratase [Haemophilus influenzae]|uniref:enoyl-CoA hydratase n=1 Tax=Haemophilus influenzae TaxID=727 RepID=UPI000E33282B|nr:enoyl-CoA hydratase [Haemophilus influenzae]AXP54248.1 enoyl-CoA hydratase [Haemophilus influenzae]AXP61051.1 enoyl-CoA hydratase [Haemophilus influenzae]AYO33748.1 enoyl-CoA hydratase [Haemophilus influenzae]MCK8953707.1 enoyl-CoA hydratase [Haemophilus influenzae]MCK9097194.1 enoyl-CoA hydratase [Haemophilus influenzae]
MAKVYLAMYKHKRDWCKEPVKAIADRITRFFTKGGYSHCEIAVQRIEFTNGHHYEHHTVWDCYSSSVQDGGVRCKQIDVYDREKWDLIPLDGVTEAQIKAYFDRTLGCKYDWWGALGIVLGIKQKRSKYFCSEWCFNALRNTDQGWRFSPNQLAVMFNKRRI